VVADASAAAAAAAVGRGCDGGAGRRAARQRNAALERTRKLIVADQRSTYVQLHEQAEEARRLRELLKDSREKATSRRAGLEGELRAARAEARGVCVPVADGMPAGPHRCYLYLRGGACHISCNRDDTERR
jgi:hypothetical protein